MDKQSLFKSIAEFVILRGNDVVHHNFENKENCDELDIFVKTVSHFVYLYEEDFINVFFGRCNAETSEEQFLNFVKSGIKVLGSLEGNLGYLLPCAFVREVVSQLKKRFMKIFFEPTLICLEQFLQKKLEGSEPNKIWKLLLSYCEDVNKKLGHVESSSESESSSDDQSWFVKSNFSPSQVYAEKRKVLMPDNDLNNKVSMMILLI